MKICAICGIFILLLLLSSYEKLSVSNPDIGLDNNDNILLADLEHNNVLPTNLNIFDYICDENE